MRIEQCEERVRMRGVGGVLGMCKQEMVGWTVGGVNTWQESVSINVGVSSRNSSRPTGSMLSYELILELKVISFSLNLYF